MMPVKCRTESVPVTVVGVRGVIERKLNGVQYKAQVCLAFSLFLLQYLPLLTQKLLQVLSYHIEGIKRSQDDES